MEIQIYNKTNYNKGMKKIDSLVKRAERERDTKGYRENLGYDQQNKLEDYLGTLTLTDAEQAKLIQLFYAECGKI